MNGDDKRQALADIRRSVQAIQRHLEYIDKAPLRLMDASPEQREDAIEVRRRLIEQEEGALNDWIGAARRAGATPQEIQNALNGRTPRNG